ncbi:glycosyltransferase family 2 protein [uncultured Paracoccus sp.]|uniref:glycosyltransferase family 2 protein n=1 Tax=uncultured Paracoccus sp. TaxID=189685 RepID=UPI00260F7CAE|nr:glycosyltransferase family 2 protein [uncultured Paracoccus sp.]
MTLKDLPPSLGIASGSAPLLSVVMANFRGAAYLADAMNAVLAQSERRLELIVVDDASDDDSVAIARRIGADDRRVRVIASAVNQGPAATRNLALDAARGDWIAIVDSDDLIHPQRLARLVVAAEAADAAIVADDLVHFGALDDGQGRTLLQSLSLVAPMELRLDLYLRGNSGDPRLPGFGYLKPLIRRDVLGARRYDPAMRIGEDYDLILRLLIDGARFLLLPDPLYAYRRHPGSISHRLSVDTVEAMLAAHEALPPLSDPAARRAAAAVGRQLRRTLRYERLVADIKARRWAGVLPRLADPAMLRRLVDSMADRRRRRVMGGRNRAAGITLQVQGELPPSMPAPGQPWDRPPAPIAARIAVRAPTHMGSGPGATEGAPDRMPAATPDWVSWLAGAVARQG